MNETPLSPRVQLRLARLALRLNQTDTGKLIGTTQIGTSRIENGKLIPTPEMAERIEQIFRIPADAWKAAA